MPDADEPIRAPERSLAVRDLVWTGLLARWIDFAKASTILPDHAEDDTDLRPRWKRSVVPIIELQATIRALGELDEVPVADRPRARDLAEVVVRRAAGALDEAWSGVPLPDHLLELLDDANLALRAAIYAGIEEIVWPGPGRFIVPAFDVGSELVGTLAVMPPGTIALPGEPISWWTERERPTAPAEALAGCIVRRAEAGPLQVYREVDPHGRFVRDVVAPLEGELPAGLPLLVALSIDGSAAGRFLHPSDQWLAMQERAFAGRATIPVVYRGDGSTDGPKRDGRASDGQPSKSE
jgi:hypothetical protein